VWTSAYACRGTKQIPFLQEGENRKLFAVPSFTQKKRKNGTSRSQPHKGEVQIKRFFFGQGHEKKKGFCFTPPEFSKKKKKRGGKGMAFEGGEKEKGRTKKGPMTPDQGKIVTPPAENAKHTPG